MSELSQIVDLLMDKLPPSTEKVLMNQSYGYKSTPYIQHIPEEVEQVQKEFLELCSQVLDNDFYSKGKVHRQGIVGRYLDDCGINELSRAWHRFMCIDEEYKEWTQPYYANLGNTKAKEDMVCINSEPGLLSYFRDKKINKILE